MRKINMRTMSRIFVGLSILLMGTANLSSIIYFNGTGKSFIPPPGVESGISSSSTQTIEDHVVEGASYFLKSYSEILSFLNKMELAEQEGLNEVEVREILENAILNMEIAKDIYKRLVQKADESPYNLDVIERLANFQYIEFLNKNDLNKGIFIQVKKFLEDGKIREMYAANLDHIDQILKKAYAVKAEIDKGLFPESEELSALNESYSFALTFGQYAARIFGKIKEDNYKKKCKFRTF